MDRERRAAAVEAAREIKKRQIKAAQHVQHVALKGLVGKADKEFEDTPIGTLVWMTDAGQRMELRALDIPDPGDRVEQVALPGMEDLSAEEIDQLGFLLARARGIDPSALGFGMIGSADSSLPAIEAGNGNVIDLEPDTPGRNGKHG